MLSDIAAKPRGRPLDPAKHDAILAAARDLFMEQGREATIDAIALKAGVARQTVYNRWPTKNALFEAIIAQTVDGLTAPVSSAHQDDPPQRVLTALAERYVEVLFDPGRIKMLRLLMQEADESGFASTWYAAGPGRMHQRLADYLKHQARQGRLTIADSDLAAEHFFGLLKGALHLRALVGLAAEPTRAEKAHRVASAVRLFLAAHQP
jgi:TetR/AcrR family transcriptional regulator, mexJK operon transcriptional repressor